MFESLGAEIVASVIKFWTGGFVLAFVASVFLGIPGGLYFLLIAGLTEASNPIGGLFATIGIALLALPGLVVGARYLWLRRG